MRVPASQRVNLVFMFDVFHQLQEGEIAKSRQRVKTLVLNQQRSRGGT
jgi:hypothetical protein